MYKEIADRLRWLINGVHRGETDYSELVTFVTRYSDEIQWALVLTDKHKLSRKHHESKKSKVL